MKQRSTTPVSTSGLAMRAALVAAAILVVTALPMSITQRVSADQYDDKISALQQQINSYNTQAKQLQDQAATLQTAINELNNQIATIRTQIDLNQAKYDKLVIQVAETEKKIKDNQDALGSTLADMYVDGQITPVEMLASSSNIGDYLDKQEYTASIRDQLVTTIAKIKTLKTELDTQKTDVQKIIDDQKAQQATLVTKQNDQQSLLDKTNSDEATYQSLISKNQSQIASVKATQAEMAARIQNTGGATLVASGSMTDYPWNSSNCWMTSYFSNGGSDGNGGDGHGYGCRQCASYVAWRIAKETGKYYTWGNAVNFTSGAINAGYQSGGPQAGSIAVMDPWTAGNNEGHVAWVEAVDGNKVLISQYNYNYGSGFGLYSKMWLSSGAFDHYVKII